MAHDGSEADDPTVAAWRGACSRFPGVELALAAFRAHLTARRPPDVALAQYLATYCIDDVFLACACASGDPAAIRAFERDCIPAIDAALARWDRAIADDTRQRLRAMMLVDHGGRGPLLATYNGRGALRSWVRVVAAREAGRVWRDHPAGVGLDDDSLFDQLAPPSDPAMSAIRREAAAAVKRAFVAALAELPRRERAALRLHVLDGLTIDDIAPMYEVHRATVARWIAAAKEQALDQTRRKLMRELDLDADEVESLIRLVQSRIDLTEETLLRSQE